MKKLGILFVVSLVCLAGNAGNLGDSWVMTRDGKMECKKVILGLNKARVTLENGQKEALTFDAISSLSRNGTVFNKLRIYENGKPTNQMAFMELINSWNNLDLYRLRYINLDGDPQDVTYRYFLYEGKKLHLQLDERSLKNTCVYFGLDYNTL